MMPLNKQFSSAYYYFIPFGTNVLHNAICILKPKLDRDACVKSRKGSHNNSAEQDYLRGEKKTSSGRTHAT
jgi:hypothetical protein